MKKIRFDWLPVIGTFIVCVGWYLEKSVNEYLGIGVMILGLLFSIFFVIKKIKV